MSKQTWLQSMKKGLKVKDEDEDWRGAKTTSKKQNRLARPAHSPTAGMTSARPRRSANPVNYEEGGDEDEDDGVEELNITAEMDAIADAMPSSPEDTGSFDWEHEPAEKLPDNLETMTFEERAKIDVFKDLHVGNDLTPFELRENKLRAKFKQQQQQNRMAVLNFRELLSTKSRKRSESARDRSPSRNVKTPMSGVSVSKPKARPIFQDPPLPLNPSIRGPALVQAELSSHHFRFANPTGFPRYTVQRTSTPIPMSDGTLHARLNAVVSPINWSDEGEEEQLEDMELLVAEKKPVPQPDVNEVSFHQASEINAGMVEVNTGGHGQAVAPRFASQLNQARGAIWSRKGFDFDRELKRMAAKHKGSRETAEERRNVAGMREILEDLRRSNWRRTPSTDIDLAHEAIHKFSLDNKFPKKRSNAPPGGHAEKQKKMLGGPKKRSFSQPPTSSSITVDVPPIGQLKQSPTSQLATPPPTVVTRRSARQVPRVTYKEAEDDDEEEQSVKQSSSCCSFSLRRPSTSSPISPFSRPVPFHEILLFCFISLLVEINQICCSSLPFLTVSI